MRHKFTAKTLLPAKLIQASVSSSPTPSLGSDEDIKELDPSEIKDRLLEQLGKGQTNLGERVTRLEEKDKQRSGAK